MKSKKVNKFVHTSYGNHHVQIISPPRPLQQINLVFLHDALGSIPQWKTFPEELVQATKIKGYVIERIGHGRSDVLPQDRGTDYLHKEALDNLPVILNFLNIENPLIIGHSDGATIGLLYASKYRPLGLVLLAPHTFVEKQTLDGIRTIINIQDQLVSKLELYHGNKSSQLFRNWKNIWLSELFRSWNIFEELVTVYCPILVIQGEEDQYGTVAQIDSIQHKTSSSYFEKLLIKEITHSPHLESMQITLDSILSFLKTTGIHKK